MGVFFSLISESFLCGFPSWRAKDMPDLSGKVAIVTGGNSGVGYETVKALLDKNAKVYLAARSMSKATAAIEQLKRTTGKEAYWLKVDLADLKSVKEAVQQFTSKETELHILINNGGIMMCPKDMLSEKGVDLQFATNVLGHFYLTQLLLPTLLHTHKTTGKTVRVCTTTSMMHHMTRQMDFNTFKDGPARRRLSVQDLYSQSKLGDLIIAKELARRYGDQGIISTAVNPGNLRTNLGKHFSLTSKENIATSLLQIYPASWGALNQLWATTMPEAELVNGEYLRPWTKVGHPNPLANDPKLGQDLWIWLEQQVQNI